MDLVYDKYVGDSQQSLPMGWIRKVKEREKSRMDLFCLEQMCE